MRGIHWSEPWITQPCALLCLWIAILLPLDYFPSPGPWAGGTAPGGTDRAESVVGVHADTSPNTYYDTFCRQRIGSQHELSRGWLTGTQLWEGRAAPLPRERRVPACGEPTPVRSTRPAMDGHFGAQMYSVRISFSLCCFIYGRIPIPRYGYIMVNTALIPRSRPPLT